MADQREVIWAFPESFEWRIKHAQAPGAAHLTTGRSPSPSRRSVDAT